MAGELHEKCAVVGVSSGDEEASATEFAASALLAMQHRGEDASGIASFDPEYGLRIYKEPGRVDQVFDSSTLHALAGRFAIGHNRYPTSGNKYTHLQPIGDMVARIALAHNGNLPQTTAMEGYLGQWGLRPTDANDSELMLYTIAQHMRQGQDVQGAIEASYPLFTGAYSCTVISDDEVGAFRDPCGIRPLSIGRLPDGGFMFASETCALDTVGATYERDVNPGELVIAAAGNLESRQLAEANPKLDIFEMVYFARQDSMLYGQSAAYTRWKLGTRLAQEHPIAGDNTVVVGVPDSAVPVAEGYAQALHLDHVQAITRDRYFTGRSFLQPTQATRAQMVSQKSHFIPEFIRGRDLVVIDDSIVRMTTMRNLVGRLRQYNPASISVLVGSPPIGFPDFYGIDTPSQDELAAANLSIEEIKAKIGCEYLGYLSLEGMVAATGQPADVFNLSCFTGEYPVDIGDRARDLHKPAWMDNSTVASKLF